MCILISAPSVSVFPDQYLRAFIEANPDGAGFVAFDRRRGMPVIRHFLRVVTPEPVETWEEVESEIISGRPVIDADRLARLNRSRIKRGQPIVDADDLEGNPDLERWRRACSVYPRVRRKVRKVTHRRPYHEVSVDDIAKALGKLEPDSPIIFHARLCTHGSVAIDNCHPFAVPRSNAILAHNGVIPGMGTSSYGKWSYWQAAADTADDENSRSDTREFCEDYLAGMSASEIWAARKLVGKVGGAQSKFAIMDGTSGDIHWIGSWEHIDANGVTYSNLHWFKGEGK